MDRTVCACPSIYASKRVGAVINWTSSTKSGCVPGCRDQICPAREKLPDRYKRNDRHDSEATAKIKWVIATREKLRQFIARH